MLACLGHIFLLILTSAFWSFLNSDSQKCPDCSWTGMRKATRGVWGKEGGESGPLRAGITLTSQPGGSTADPGGSAAGAMATMRGSLGSEAGVGTKGRETLRNWLMPLWGLASLKSVGQAWALGHRGWRPAWRQNSLFFGKL